MGEAGKIGTDWPVVGLAVGAGIVVALQVGKVPAAIPALRAELGLGLVTAGWVASMFNAVGALGGLLAGVLADRIGYRRTVVGGLVIVALGSAAGGLADGVAVLLLSRLLEGFGFVATVVAAPAIIAAHAGPRHARLSFGFWGAFLPTGMAVMMLLSPALLGGFGWRGLWLLNAAIVLGYAAVFAAATRRAAPAARVRRTWSEVIAVGLAPGPWLLGGCFAAYTVQFYGLMAWLPTIIVERLGRTPDFAAIIAGLVVLSNVGGNLGAGWLLQRGFARWRLIATAVLSLGLLALPIYAAATPDTIRLALMFGFSVIGGMLPAAVLAGAPAHSPRPTDLGTINGVIVQGSNIGAVLGPPLVAATVAYAGGWQAPGWLLLGAGLIGAGLAIALGRIERRAVPAAP